MSAVFDPFPTTLKSAYFVIDDCLTLTTILKLFLQSNAAAKYSKETPPGEGSKREEEGEVELPFSVVFDVLKIITEGEQYPLKLRRRRIEDALLCWWLFCLS